MILPFAMVASTVGAGSMSSWVDPCEEEAASATVPSLDTTLLREVLKANVHHGTRNGVQSALFDYSSVRKDPSQIRGYLQQLCKLDINSLTPQESLAMHINAYNALMIAVVLHFAPEHSVKQVSEQVPSGTVWKQKFGTIGGGKVSFDDIEHGTIRAGLSSQVGVQARVHAGLVCGSLSCPDLQPEPYDSATVVGQLTAATQGWLANPTKNPGPDEAGALKLSQIFQWYGKDFAGEAGTIVKYTSLYGPSSWRVTDDTKIGFLPYDWNLNTVKSAERTGSALQSVGRTNQLRGRAHAF